MTSARRTFLRRFGWAVGYTAIFLLLSFGVYAGITKVFSITAIQVISQNIQVSVDQKRLPKTLLFFPSEKIREQLLAANPTLANIEFQKRYPHTLVIIPTIRTPAAILVTDSRKVYLDPGGMVLADVGVSTLNITTVTIPISSVRVGQKIADTRVLASLAFIVGARSILPIDSITVLDEASLQAKSGTVGILFTQHGQMQLMLATLQTLVAGFRIKGTLPAVIDLRFDKPIVIF